jgi:hypothetical protein
MNVSFMNNQRKFTSTSFKSFTVTWHLCTYTILTFVISILHWIIFVVWKHDTFLHRDFYLTNVLITNYYAEQKSSNKIKLKSLKFKGIKFSLNELFILDVTDSS